MGEEKEPEIDLSPELGSKSEELFRDPTSKKFLPLAEEYRKSNMYDEAIYLCREGLKHHPDFLPAKVTLARCYMGSNQNEEAEAVLLEIIVQSPDYIAAHRYLGDIYFRKGDVTGAKEHYQEVAKSAPGDEEVIERLKELGVEDRDWMPESVDVSGKEAAEQEIPRETGTVDVAEVETGLTVEAGPTEGEGPPDLDLEPVEEHEDLELRLEADLAPTGEADAEEKEIGISLSSEESEDAEIPGAETEMEGESLETGPEPVVAEVIELESLTEEELSRLSGEELRLGRDDIVAEGAPPETEVAEMEGLETADELDEEEAEITPLEVPDLMTAEPAEEAIGLEITEPESEVAEDEAFGFDLAGDAGLLGVNLSPDLEEGVEEQPVAEPQVAREDAGGEESKAEIAVSEESPAPPTLTSAKVYEEQGHLDEALRIYRVLHEQAPDDEHVLSKINELEGLLAPPSAPPEAEQNETMELLRRWLANIEEFRSGMTQ